MANGAVLSHPDSSLEPTAPSNTALIASSEPAVVLSFLVGISSPLVVGIVGLVGVAGAGTAGVFPVLLLAAPLVLPAPAAPVPVVGVGVVGIGSVGVGVVGGAAPAAGIGSAGGGDPLSVPPEAVELSVSRDMRGRERRVGDS